jgi:hypothetical protein
MTRIAVLLVVLCATARADVKTVKAAKLSIDVPATWKVDVKDDTLKGESKDKDIALLAWTVDSADVAAAQKKVEGELYSAVASLKWSKPTTAKVHGLAVSYVDGIGHAVGGDVDIKTAIVGPTAAKKAVIVVAAVAHAKADAHKAEIKTLFESAQAAK